LVTAIFRRGGAPFGEGTANFEVMREWNRSGGLSQDHGVLRRSADGAM